MTGHDAGLEELVEVAAQLVSHGLTHGSTGNLSVRQRDRITITPTGSRLATIGCDDLSVIDLDGRHLSGRRPSKEAWLHASIYQARPADAAIVHTHSTHAVAVSCLPDLDAADAISAYTPYFCMKVGRVGLVNYFAPGDAAAAAEVLAAARDSHALLLARHGPVTSGPDLMDALEALEELEETARLHLLLRGMHAPPLSEAERDRLRPAR
jgi:ribulose-5-phosphate 4-epimerase/fuculose-1-phosphate aldolase